MSRRSPLSPRTVRNLAVAVTGLALLAARGFIFTSSAGPAAGPREVFVQRAVDGDTVLLSMGERVRYIGVDTPELHHPRKPVQFYGREAMEFNRNLVEGKSVRLEFDVERYDKYNRLLAYVYLPDGTFVNAELVRQGYARLMTIPPNVKHAELFRKLQAEAREAGRGLWGRR
ncbi:MAG: thermonuclease family protein [Candidatus Omnitrophica bacterium]|nr:thermonuclease family protein [Candidatus Omnitrophota bacterium]